MSSIGALIKDGLKDFIEYKTPKIVHIKNKKIGICNRIIQLAILVYVIVYAIVYKKGYQEFSDIESSVTVKVKGSLSTKNLNDSDFNPMIDRGRIPYYKKIWDTPDYNIPSSDTDGFFIMTNVVITPNQIQGVCAEDDEVKGAICSSDADCTEGKILPLGNGPLTGKCLIPANETSDADSNSSAKNGTCEIQAWCPLEEDIMPLKDTSRPLLAKSGDFTVLIKNTVNFPKFKQIGKFRNIFDTQNKTFLQSCTYADVDSEGKSNLCPIFVLKDIVASTGEGNTYENIGIKGGVVGINIDWTCNLDYNRNYCKPKYSFTRLDQTNATLSPGWNFRYANYYNDGKRTLFKAYGIRFVVTTTGTGGKFNFVPLLINVGSGLGLMAVTTIICDFIAFYFTEGKDYYREKKYLYVEEVDTEYEVNQSTSTSSLNKYQTTVYSSTTAQNLTIQNPIMASSYKPMAATSKY